MPPAQTIAQAKASFKARGRPSLTDKQQKQLQRACELEQRAERIKEQEKKRAAAAVKRKAEGQDGKDRQKAFLGTQMRRDKFGYKSSQFHLGAFLQAAGRRVEGQGGSLAVQDEVVEEEDLFEDDGLDDEMMLSALEAVPTLDTNGQSGKNIVVQDTVKHSKTMPPLPIPRLPTTHKPPRPAQSPNAEEDLSSFWEDLDSSTQIARDLDDSSTDFDNDVASSLNTSFGSGSFDLTAEELDKLDPPPMPTASVEKTRPLPAPNVSMLPPPLPAKRSPIPARQMPPPKKPQSIAAKEPKRQNVIKGPFLPARSLYCSPDLGFTLSQLENFVEDDLQLTQAVPG
ncbi:unnamed protein product [Zymoseptoria tritici ST99CH_1A5]|uniref:Uncharacterized protein n=1 Tax=Zymoseptoria tritici ST99CH_1A5 TaxID=1276529 RepID=A0A1Y6L2J9_ZYMTR|nr:unnamed protein product [Zymoseptoria tritici ST99CH_3D1]SMY18683.1 unnamed protein product [Zymoseptoria tritici ST99CH_1A5]